MKVKILKNEREVLVNDKKIELTPKEYEILLLFIKNPGIVYTREKLLEIVWELNYEGGTRTVDIHIQRLRKKLGDNANNIIKTVHGVGYKGAKI